MHMAAEAGHVEVVTLLVESGASLRAESLVSCCCKLVIVLLLLLLLLCCCFVIAFFVAAGEADHVEVVTLLVWAGAFLQQNL